MIWQRLRDLAWFIAGVCTTYVAVLMAVGLVPCALEPWAYGFPPGKLGEGALWDFAARHGSPPSRNLAGSLALGLGSLLFWAELRIRWRFLHRWLGFVYLASVVMAALSMFFREPPPIRDILPLAAFYSQALPWLFTGGQACAAARAGRIDRHRAWMVRNYAVTFAVVTSCLAGYCFTAEVVTLNFVTAIYPQVCWASWAVNLLVVEIILRAEARAQRCSRCGAELPDDGGACTRCSARRKIHPMVPAVLAVVTLGVLAFIVLPWRLQARVRGNLAACHSNLNVIRSATEMYRTDNGGHYPTSLVQLTPIYLKVIPTCPEAGTEGYSYHSYHCGGYEEYWVNCAPEAHPGLNR